MKNAASRLVLGTAQFGSDYGITNVGGRVDDGQLKAILELALELGITRLDTALEYGDAQRRLRPWVDDFIITTKVKGVAGVGPSVGTCLEQLGVTSLDEVLIHDWASLDAAGRETAADALVALRDDGLVTGIGISVYDGDELLDAAQLIDAIDAVQVPVNVLDQRMAASPALQVLCDEGCVVEARSVLLQGLLAASQPSHPAVIAFQSACREAGVSAVAGAVGFVAGLNWVDELVIGVTTPEELREIAEAASVLPDAWMEACASLASDDLALLDPRRWNTS